MSALILASGSAVRARLLHAAGVPFTVRPASVDETGAKAVLLAQGRDHGEVAVALAELKAAQVAAANPDSLVLGCDQLLVLGGEIVNKVTDTNAARVLLCRLRGRAHSLLTAAVLMRQGRTVWHRMERCHMQMRVFSDGFLDGYLAAEGPEILASVGCYQLEGRGAQLFERIEGDHFAVLGLPMIPLLVALREQGVLAP